MEQLFEVRTRLLLDMWTDFSRQMSELHALRDAVRVAEATVCDAEPVHQQSSGRRYHAVSCALKQAD